MFCEIKNFYVKLADWFIVFQVVFSNKNKGKRQKNKKKYINISNLFRKT